MASTSPSCASSKESSSAWSRLVQITRVASNTSRSHPTQPPKASSQVTSTQTHTPSSARPAKRRRVSDSTASRCAKDDPATPASQPSEAHTLRSQCHEFHIFYPAAGHDECTTACPCQVEDVECVAPARQKRETVVKASADLRESWVTQSDGESMMRQSQEDVDGLKVPRSGIGYPDEQTSTPQPPDSPSRSCDSISEAELSDREDISGQQLQGGVVMSSQVQDMKERSIHEIGAVLAPRRRQPLSESKQTARRKTWQQPSASTFRRTRDRKTEDAPPTQEPGQQAQKSPSASDRSLSTSTQLPRIDAQGAATEADPASDTREAGPVASLREVPEHDGVGLDDGDQITVNKTPKLVRQPSNSTNQGDDNQLITPSTSPTPKADTQVDEHTDGESVSQKPSLVAKTKRRLNLHSGSYSNQHPQKKRKTPPKKQSSVQTTLSLNIGAGAGMKECKLCDTVYNPFHPDDVKVHAKRHAVVLKNGVKV